MPILMGFNPNTALLFSGIGFLFAYSGSLLFFVITAGRIPAYLGSSAAFLAVIKSATSYSGVGINPNIDIALGGIFVTGCIYLTIALGVQVVGVRAIEYVLPPVICTE